MIRKFAVLLLSLCLTPLFFTQPGAEAIDTPFMLAEENASESAPAPAEPAAPEPAKPVEKAAEAPPAKAEEPAPPAAPVTGSIGVTSVPTGVDILLDGTKAGKTPMVLTNVTPGNHAIKLVKDGYFEYEEPVTVKAGVRAEVAVVLKEIQKDRMPPQIIHKKGESPREGRSYTVKTLARDDVAVKNMFLFFRSRGDADYQKTLMLPTGGDNYEGVVSSNFVRGTVLEYYLVAEDTSGNTSMDGTADIPYDVKIIPADKEPPVIVHQAAKGASDVSPFVISAKVTDNVTVASVTLFHRHAGEKDYVKENMAAGANGQYSYKVAPEFVKKGMFEYYIEASDDSGNTARSGKAAEPLTVRVVQVMPHYDGMVVERKGETKEVVVSLGTAQGVKKGDTLTVVRMDERILDPVTQEVLTVRQALVGKVKVITPSQQSSIAQVESEVKNEKVASGFLIRMRNDAIGGLSAQSPKIRQVDLAWTPTKEPEAAGYVIYRGTSRDGAFTKVGTVKGAETGSWADTDSKASPVKDATTYFYRVAAINTDNVEGNFSDTVSATTKGGPDGPASLKAVSGEIRQITFSWPKATDPDAAGYVIQKAESAQGEFTDALTVKGAGDTNAVLKHSNTAPLEDGKTYYFRILAMNKVGATGKPSAPIEAATHAKPAAPAAPRVSKEFVRSLTIAWDSHPDKDIAGYNVYRKDPKAAEFKKIEDTGNKTFTFTDKGNHLLDASEYQYAITAFLKGGVESPLSDPVSGTTFGPPETPTGLTASQGKFREVQLKWTPINKEEISGYEIYRMDGAKAVSIEKISGKDKSSFSDKGGFASKLLDAKPYQYKIASYNVADVHSPLSDAAEGVTKPLPVKPSGLAASSGEVKQTKLEWAANPEKDIKEYTVWKSAGTDKKGSSEASSKGTSAVIKGLDDGATYYFRVSATDADGLESEASDSVKISTKPLPQPPGAPSATPAAKSVSLSWGASPTSDVVKYNVYVEGFFSASLAGSSNGTSLEITKDIKPDSSYTFFIKAVDATGLESKPSGNVKVKTPKQ